MTFFLALLLSFPHLQETIPSGPFAYVGKAPREEILVDPKNCPTLDRAYADLKKRLNSSFSQWEILVETFLFVQDELFDLPNCSWERVQDLIREKNQKEIPLDFFLDNRLGVCRHIALTVTCLIDRLIREEFLEGEAFLIRDEVFGARHAWTLFLSEKGAYHLDVYQSLFENGKTRAGFSYLCQKYGRETMERQKERWEHDN